MILILVVIFSTLGVYLYNHLSDGRNKGALYQSILVALGAVLIFVTENIYLGIGWAVVVVPVIFLVESRRKRAGKDGE